LNTGDFMSSRTFNNEAKIKLTQLINEGMAVMQEVETLNEGLTDTVKAIAEELEVKPSILKKAIRVAYKSRLGETNKENEELNTILETVGKTL
jgi:transposase-like protein